jgi:hypothetical protein
LDTTREVPIYIYLTSNAQSAAITDRLEGWRRTQNSTMDENAAENLKTERRKKYGIQGSDEADCPWSLPWKCPGIA